MATRREVLAAGAALALAGGIGRESRAQGAQTTLRVATWGGSWRDSLDRNVAPLLAAKGIRIEYVLGNPDDNISRLIAARREGQVAFDVMEFTPAQKTLLVRAGVFADVDYHRLTNAVGIPAWAREQQLVSVQYTGMGIGYNRDRLKAAGVAPPQRYEDLNDPKLRAHLSWPEPANGAHWTATVALAYAGGGSEANMTPALARINQIRPATFYASSPEVATRFGSADVWIAPWESGWALRLRKSGLPIDVVYPQLVGDHHGGLWPIAQGIVKGSPQIAAAHEFINAFLSPGAQYGHGISTGSLPVNEQARVKLAQDAVMKSMLLLSDAQIERAYQVNWNALDARRWRAEWDRGVSR